MRSLIFITVVVVLLLLPCSVSTKSGTAGQDIISVKTELAGSWDWYWYYLWRAIYEAKEHIRSKKPPALSCPAPPLVALFITSYSGPR